MANLSNIMKIMDIKVDSPTFNNKVSGKKRRYWISNENNNEITTEEQQNNNETSSRKHPENIQKTIKTTSREQSDIDQISTRHQPGSDRDNKEAALLAENMKNSVFLLISNLVGLQKKLFNYILSLCLERDETNTGHVSTVSISEAIGCSYGTTKVTMARLVKKGLVKRLKGKGCRGGFVDFEITKSIKIAAIKIKQQENNQRTTGYQPDNRQDNIKNSSSCSILNTTTTREEQSSDEFRTRLSTERLNLDIEPLTFIGFTKTHLSQIASQNKLSAQIVQDSIYSFAFDLEKNDKAKSIKGDPINFFMGILRKGEPYVAPSNYESPQDKAMRLYMERKKKIEQGREAIEKESKDLAYREWFSRLTDDQKRQFLPENLRRNARVEKSKFLEGGAKVYFETEVWPGKKNEITEEASITEYTEQGEVIEKE